MNEHNKQSNSVDYKAMFLIAMKGLKEIDDKTEYLHFYNKNLTAADYRKIIEKCLDNVSNDLMHLDKKSGLDSVN